MPRSARKTAWVCVWFSRRSGDCGGQAPALRYARPSPFTVGRGPVPRHASICTGNGLGRHAFFAQVLRLWGTGPRATVCQAVSVYRRARACPSPCLDREGNGVGLRSFFARVGRLRGTGPRATVCEAVSVYRRARACPSPCLDREGNGVGLRSFFARVGRSRGPVPRATVCQAVSLYRRLSDL